MEPLDVVCEHFESFARGDEEAHAATYAEDCVIEEPEPLPWGGTYRGKEGQQELVQRYEQAWKEVSVTPVEYTHAGDLVYATVRLQGKTAAGSDVDMPTVECFRIGEDGILHQRVFYWDTQGLAAGF